MGKPKVRPPSKVDSLTFPVFGLTWYGAPSSPTNNDGCSVIAYCGGGGSAKTGVGNKIVVTVTSDNNDGVGNSSVDDAGGNNNTAQQQQQQQQQQYSSSPSTTRQILISTGEALCFGVHAFRPYNDSLNMVRLLACVGDDILLYGIPLSRKIITDNIEHSEGADTYVAEEEKIEEATLLAKTSVGKGYGANVATYSACHVPPNLLHFVAVGCENGTLVNFQLTQTKDEQSPSSLPFEFTKVSECQGHTKAICAINFHPRGTQLLSSAKDGTARIFDAHNGAPLAVLKCEVHDPAGPAPVAPDPTKAKTRDPRMMRRAPQILVRGCAYGDLEGRVVYAVASGKRGPAYLTRWRTVVPSHRAPSASSSGGPPGAPPSSFAPTTTTTPSFQREYRIQCSPVPVSATSLSSDGTLLALGSVEGSISLYDLEKRSVVKQFSEVHDLPVTCMASRPVPSALMMPGEAEGGVNFDAVSASADNRFGRYTLQKRSRIKTVKPPRSARRKSALEVYLWELMRIPLLLVLLLAIVAVRDTMDICSEEFGFSTLVMDSGASARHCLYREVLWAEESKVSFVPQ